jgi:hypothetical protein
MIMNVKIVVDIVVLLLEISCIVVGLYFLIKWATKFYFINKTLSNLSNDEKIAFLSSLSEQVIDDFAASVFCSPEMLRFMFDNMSKFYASNHFNYLKTVIIRNDKCPIDMVDLYCNKDMLSSILTSKKKRKQIENVLLEAFKNNLSSYTKEHYDEIISSKEYSFEFKRKIIILYNQYKDLT